MEWMKAKRASNESKQQPRQQATSNELIKYGETAIKKVRQYGEIGCSTSIRDSDHSITVVLVTRVVLQIFTY
jgi:hypothetical protein